MKPQKKAKLQKRLDGLESEMRQALMRKTNGAAEIDIDKIQSRIDSARKELTLA